MRTFEIAEPGDASVLRHGEREAPRPAAGQILVQVAYAGLNFTDVLARRGAPGYAPSWPFVPGMEVAGTVVALGDGVEGHDVGDAVLAFTPDGGGFAELVVADARLAAGVPRGLALSTAAGLPLTWATAIGLVRRARVEADDTVLVTSAAGGVAAALAQVLGVSGPRVVVGGVGSEAKIDHLHPRYTPVVRTDDFYDRAVAAAGGPLDVVLDSVGGDVLGSASERLAVGGRLISFGAAAGRPDPASPTLAALRAGNQTVSGFSILRLARTAPQKAGALVRDAVQLANGSRLDSVPAPHVVPWEALQEAHVEQSEGRATGKTVVEVQTTSSGSR